MYLLAAKSFARRVNPRAVYVVDDGSLSRRRSRRCCVIIFPASHCSRCRSSDRSGARSAAHGNGYWRSRCWCRKVTSSNSIATR